MLIPNVEIFKEIMVELLKSREIDIPALKKERSEFIQESSGGFQLNEMLLNLLEEQEQAGSRKIRTVSIYRTADGATVTFSHISNEQGIPKTIRCSNIQFHAEY